ncbi:MAG TPA: hemolysin family protein [Polyangiaceae bacterium]
MKSLSPPPVPSLRPPSIAPRPSTAKGLVGTVILVGLLAAVSTLSLWVLSAVLIVGCGVCVAFEFALVKVSARQLERDQDKGIAGAHVLLAMKRDMNSMLAACQFGITLTSLGLTLALEPALHVALAEFEKVAAFSIALAMGVGAFLHVTFGELIPKGMALVVPLKVLYVTAPFMRLFRVLAVPFIKTCNAIANAAVQFITGKHPDTDAHHEEDVEIDDALLVAQASGQIRPEQLKVMRNVLAFVDRTVREVMTPARRVAYLDIQRSWEDNLKAAEEHGFSRFPVADGDLNKLVGYVRRAELLKAELLQKRDLKALLLPIERRPEVASLAQLNLFQGTPMIAVYDEHDTFTGLLTAEDIVEQIVGEIYDDTDERVASEIEALADGSIRMRGAVLLETAAETIGLEELLEHQDVDTIGGLILKILARQPATGDTVELGGYSVLVEGAKGFRILSLLFRPLPPAVDKQVSEVAEP